MDDVGLTAIGIYRSDAANPYEVGRQPREDDVRRGEVVLDEAHAALTAELAGVRRVWLIFQFHENNHWKPMVRPPRGSDRKLGVFATRAPYRPNPLGLSCVRLVSVDGPRVVVEGADLLDGTPIFDVKPYVAEVDALEDARAGWLEGVEENRYAISWTPLALEQLGQVEKYGVSQLAPFVQQQLEFEPFDDRRKRLTREGDSFLLAYRTWRVLFHEIGPRALEILELTSGYSDADLQEAADKWGDKDDHRDFLKRYPRD